MYSNKKNQVNDVVDSRLLSAQHCEARNMLWASLSVCLAVCHTHESRLLRFKLSKYA